MEIHYIQAAFQEVLDTHAPTASLKKVKQEADKFFISIQNLSQNQTPKDLAQKVTDKLYENGLRQFYVEVDEGGGFHVVNLVDQLQKWVNDPSIRGDKETAKRKILKRYNEKSTELNLSELDLTSLPPEIGRLINLKELNLHNNQLTSIPPNIGDLLNLQELQLSYNELTSIPPEIGNLTNLKGLQLSYNELTSIPADLGLLTNLEQLNLSNNQLTSIPADLGRLINLQWLSLSNNTSLETLPISLGNIPTLTEIEMEGNSQAVIQSGRAILEACRRLRDNQSTQKLPATLNLWKTYANSKKDLSLIQSFDNKTQVTICEWLLRLSGTREFQHKQKELAKIVCDKLALLQYNDDFKNTFLAIAESNNTRCEDRSAMSFNLTYTHFKLHSLNKDAPFEEKFHLYMQGAKTWTLRSHVESLIKNNHPNDSESVEVFLYVETALKESLNLLSAISTHNYAEAIGNKSYINLDEIKTFVEEHYLDELTQFPGIEDLAKQDEEIANEWKKAEDTYEKEAEGKEELVAKALTADMNSQKNQILIKWAQKHLTKTR